MVEKGAVRRAYDELAETYAEQRADDGPGMIVLDHFLDSLTEPTRILDAGCGQGTPVLSRIATDTTAIGVDFSHEQLRLAETTVPESLLLQGDMTDLPFNACVFDAVVAYWSLIHVPLEDHQTVLDEFARVLRPSGRVLVCEGTTDWSGENPDWLGTGVEMQWNIAGAEATGDQLRSAGFTITDRWRVPDALDASADDSSNDDAALPWTFFAAHLDG